MVARIIRQVEAAVVSNSKNKIYQTWEALFWRPLYGRHRLAQVKLSKFTPILKQTNCTPWDYPLPQGAENAQLCTTYSDGKTYFNSLRHFEMTMEDADVVTQCTEECMPNCQEVIYTYGMDTTYLKANELCNDEANLREVFIS